MIEIIQTIKKINLFDGADLINDCSSDGSYWFGTVNQKENIDTYLSFISQKGVEVRIDLFKHSKENLNLLLQSGANKVIEVLGEDISSFSSLFGFTLQHQEGKYYCSKSGSKIQMIRHSEPSGLYLLFYSFFGDRYPEGVSFYGLFEVKQASNGV